MAALSKEEYLKRYLSDDKPDSKKKKKKPKSTIQPKLKVIDDDIDFKTLLPDNLGNTLEEDVGDNDPTVAEIVDERPVHIKRLEEYRASGKWRTLNEKKNDLSNQLGVIKNNSDEDSTRIKRHDSDSDQSPPRIKIHDPDSDQSPPRIKRYDSDSDQSPPRIKRHDSDSDQSPPRIKRHDSDSDQSLTRKNRHHSGSDNSERRKLNSHERHRNLHKQSHQSYERRRRHDSDSDQSPPRRKRHDSDSDQSPPRRKKHSDTVESQQRRRKQHNSDSDQSPPRKQRRHSDSDQSPPRKQRHHSDSDQSPPRKQRRHSDSDQSPPRKQRRHSDSDQSPPRRGERRKTEGESKKATKTLSGAKAGLQSARDMKLEAEVIRRREDEAFKKIGEDKLGRYATTVHRDKSGKRRNLEEEKKKEKEADEKKAEEDKKYMEWGQGLKQKEEREKQLLDNLHEITKPLARYRDDEDLDSMLKEKIRDGDPMAMFMKKKKNTNATGDANEKPKYRGPQPPPNRYGIMPGYRWDGVDRSNGFEAKLFAHKAERRAVDMMAYKWSTEDM